MPVRTRPGSGRRARRLARQGSAAVPSLGIRCRRERVESHRVAPPSGRLRASPRAGRAWALRPRRRRDPGHDHVGSGPGPRPFRARERVTRIDAKCADDVQHCDGVVAPALLLCRRCESDDGLGGVDPKLARGDAGVCRDRRAQQTPRRSKRKRRRTSVGCRSGTRRSSDSPSGGRHGCIGESAPVGHREADDPGLRNRVKAHADESRAKVENSVAHAAPTFPETKRPDLSAPHSWLARAFAQNQPPVGL